MVTVSRNSVFVDTGAFFALRSSRDRNHDAASQTLQRLRRASVVQVTTNFVVAESHALVLRRSGISQGIAFLRDITESQVLVERVGPDDEAAARDLVFRHSDKAFSLVDATSFVVMKRLGIADVFTFDRNFTQYGFRVSQP